jgi:hypothetical protein
LFFFVGEIHTKLWIHHFYLPGKYREAAQKQLARVWQQWNDMEFAGKVEYSNQHSA